MFRRTKVFVGHASADDDLADAVIKRLQNGGLRPFVDHEPEGGIDIGRDWEEELRSSIRGAGLFVPLVSDAWLDSTWCQAEYRVAKLLGKPVAPVVLDGRLTRPIQFSEQVLRLDDRLAALDSLRVRRLRRLCPIDGRRVAVAAASVGLAGLAAWLAVSGGYHPSRQNPADMVLLPAGTFVRGAASGGEAASPQRQIRLDAFFLDRQEVAWGAFKEYLATTGNPHRPPDWTMRYMPSEQHPAVGMTWEAASRFCDWQDKRLPSEAEWERAARGFEARPYPWGDEPIAVSRERPPAPSPVDATTFDRTPEGIRNLAGNVREWVEDWYDPEYYAISPDENPVNREPSAYRAVRGGSWRDPALPEATRRGANNPDRPDPEVGFRCARDRQAQSSG